MTKLARQQLIVELVHEGPLPNQQELVKVLARKGFPVTQATLSRDINELRLVRTPEGYTLPNGDTGPDPTPAVSRVVREFVVEVRRAQNLLVLTAHELTGRGQTPAHPFADYYGPLPSWRAPL